MCSHEQGACRDRPRDDALPAASASAAKPASKCKANQIDDGGECLKACEKDSDCPAKKTCQGIRVANPFGGTSTAQACVAP